MPNLDDIRRAYPDAAGASDTELLTELSRRSGKDISVVASDFGVDIGQNNGDFTRGLRRGGQQLLGSAGGLVGLGADLVGADSVKEGALDFARRRFEQDQLLSRPTDDVTNIDSFGGAVDWAQSTLGQLVPMAASGGAAGLAGRAVGGAIARRGVAGLAEEAAKAAISRGATWGMVGGAGAQSIGQSSGAIYSDMVEDGNDDSLRALAYGTAAGALDAVPEVRALSKVFGGARAPGNLLSRVVREGGKQAGLEAATEVGQTALELQANYKDLDSPEARNAFVNAAAAGALGGGAIGALTGLPAQRREPIADAPTDLLGGLPRLNDPVPDLPPAPPALDTSVLGDPELPNLYETPPETAPPTQREGFPRLYGTPSERDPRSPLIPPAETLVAGPPGATGVNVGVGTGDQSVFDSQPVGDTLEGAYDLARQRALAGPIVEAENVRGNAAGSGAAGTVAPGSGGAGGLGSPIGSTGDAGAAALGAGGEAVQSLVGEGGEQQSALTIEALKDQFGIKTTKRVNKQREAELGRLTALINMGAVPQDAIAERMGWVKAGRMGDVKQANDVDEQTFFGAMSPEQQVQFMIGQLPTETQTVLQMAANGVPDVEIATQLGGKDKQWAQKRREAAIVSLLETAQRLGLPADGIRAAMTAVPKTAMASDTTRRASLDELQAQYAQEGLTDAQRAGIERSIRMAQNAGPGMTTGDAANLGISTEPGAGASTGFQVVSAGADLGTLESAAQDPADIVEFAPVDNTDLTNREVSEDSGPLLAARATYESWKGAGDPEWDVWGPQQKQRWLKLDRAAEDLAISQDAFDRAGVELLDEAEQGKFYARQPYFGMELSTRDADGNVWSYRYMNFARYPRVMDAMRRLLVSPMGVAYDQISGVYLSQNTGADAFVVPEGDGSYRLVLTEEFLARSTDADLDHTINHEVAHVADDSAGAAFYSSDAEWVRLVADVRRRFDTGSPLMIGRLRSFLRYPFIDDSVAPEAVNSEVFAQLWAAHLDPELRASVQQQLPEAFAYVEAMYADYARVAGRIETRAGTPRQGTGTAGTGGPSGQARPTADVGGDGPRGEGGTERVRFSKRVPPPQATGVETVVKDVLSSPAARTARAYGRKVNYALLFGHQLVDRIGAMLPAARTFFRTLQDRITVRDRREARVMEVAEKFYKLPEAEQARANRFIYESTTSQKWGYTPAWNSAAAVDSEMASKFAALTPEAQAAVKDVFAYGNETQREYEQVLLRTKGAEIEAQLAEAQAANDAGRIKAMQKAKADLLRENGALKSLLEGPYAPLKRFGRHAVVVKSQAFLDAEAAGDGARIEEMQADGDHYQVMFVDNVYERERKVDELQAKFPDSNVVGFEREPENSRSTELPIQAIKRLQQAIVTGPNGEKLSERSKRILSRMASDLYVASLDSLSARQTQQRRRNIHGADEDMMRAFVSQGRGMAHMLATLEVNGPMQESLQAMRAQARTGRTAEKSDALNEVLNRYTLLMDSRPTPVQDAAMAVTSVWMLLTNPAYWFGNATQPFMMTLPVLSGRHNAGASWSAVMQGYRDTMPALEGRALDPKKLKTLVGRESDAIQELLDRGHIDLTLEREMGEISGGWHAGHKVMSMLRFIPQRIEVANRVASALAAYRLEYARATAEGADPTAAHQQATEYADTIVLDTHGDYSSAGSPRLLMQGATQMPIKLMGQFRKFQLIQLGLMSKLIRQSFSADMTSDEKTAARWSLAWVLGTYATMTGLLGTIGVNVIWGIVSQFGEEDEKDLDLVLTRALGDRDAAILLTRGVPAMLGLDMSQRLGMGNTLSVFPFADSEPAVKDSYTNYVMAATGPFIGGLIPRAASGVDYINQGDYWKGIEMLLPNGLTNLLRAARFQTEGMTNRKGDLLLTPEDIGVMSDIFQAAGLPTTVLTDRQWKAGVLYELEQQLRSDTTRIKKQFVEASRERDTEAMAELRGEWRQLQEIRSRNGLKVQPLSNLLKAPQEKAGREASVDEGVALTSGNAGFTGTVPD